MARTVSFAPYQGDTIKALQQRQQDLARLQPSIPIRSIQNPLQGAASVVDTLATEINMARARRQEREATAGMAQLMGSFGEQGPSSEQIGAMAAYDPDLAIKLYEHRQSRLEEDARLKAQQAFTTSERQASEAFQAGQTQAGYTHEGQVDTRELEQQKELEKRQLAAQLDQERRAQEAEVAKEGRQAALPQTDVGKLKADLDAGRIDQATYDAAVKKATTATAGNKIEIMTSEVEARKKMAPSLGLKEGTPAWTSYVATGNIPKEAQLSATDKRFIQEADDLVASNQQVIDDLNSIIKPDADGSSINDRAYSGWGADEFAWMARNDPTGIFDKKAGEATTLLTNTVTGQALQNLRSIFGGNPTEGERGILLEMQASVNKSPQERRDIIDRAIKFAQKRLAINQQRADELRGGTYFQPGGGSEASSGGTDTVPVKPDGWTDEEWNALTDDEKRSIK